MPVFRKRERNSAENHHLFSIFPLVSKIFGKLPNRYYDLWLYTYMIFIEPLFSKQQCGFWKFALPGALPANLSKSFSNLSHELEDGC